MNCLFFAQKSAHAKTALSFLLLTVVVCPLLSYSQLQSHGTGALILSKKQYDALPKVNWDTLAKYASPGSIASRKIKSVTNGITSYSSTLLVNPAIGDQGSEQSCVGWAVGYTAMGIVTYPKYNCWTGARRSANYVYNQIKLCSTCTDPLCGSYTSQACELVRTQGDCSWTLFPYVEGTTDCNTLPNSTQTADAANNKATNWATLSETSVTDIKHAIDLGHPVVVGLKVYSSFYGNTGTWTSSADNSGGASGQHAMCVVGYDDNLQMLKLQNQWGTGWGNKGFVWVSYTVVQNHAFFEAYALWATTTTTPMAIKGDDNFCTTSTAYSVSNLLSGSTVVWTASPSNVVKINTPNALQTTLTKLANGTVTLTATITGPCGATYTLTKSNLISGSLAQGYYNISSNYTVSNNNVLLNGGGGSVFMPKNQSVLFSLQLTSPPALTAVSWNVTGAYSSYTTGTSFLNLYMNTPGTAYTANTANVTLTATGPCGVFSNSYSFSATANGSSSKVAVSPNPASADLEVSLTADPSSSKSASGGSTGTTLYLYDFYTRTVVKQWAYPDAKGDRYRLSVADVKKGMYLLRVVRNGQAAETKVMINR